MGDLKPIGSEKLQGQEKIKRILELAYYQNNDNDKKITTKHEYIAEGVNGYFGIDKEKDGYYVKKGLTEDTLDYIGGMFMKNKNKFNSYGDALKRLELLKSVELNEGTKYVLKQATKPAPEPAPEPAPVSDTPPVDDTEMPVDDTEMPVDGAENGEDGDPIKSIQKLTGKLGQKLRDFDADLESEDIKFVLNSIISAVDISKISEEDKDDILNNFDSTENDDFDAETADINADDSELEEVDDEYGFDEIEKAINTPLDFDDNVQADAEYSDDEEYGDYADEYADDEETPDYPGDAGVPEDEIDASDLDNFTFKDEKIYDNSELDEIDVDMNDDYSDDTANIDIEKLTNLIAQAVKASLK